MVEDENSNIITSFPWLHGSTLARIFRRAPSMDLGVHWFTNLWMFIIQCNSRKCTSKFWKKNWFNYKWNWSQIEIRYLFSKWTFFVFELRHASMEVGIPFQVQPQYWNDDLNACRPPPKQKLIVWELYMFTANLKNTPKNLCDDWISNALFERKLI